ncbi:MAG: hypothetical protein II058_02725, partial [Rhodocyclaceae bacterium]|nr:hypothetical protein [Rhodocyclaceae bacterium]
ARPVGGTKDANQHADDAPYHRHDGKQANDFVVISRLRLHENTPLVNKNDTTKADFPRTLRAVPTRLARSRIRYRSSRKLMQVKVTLYFSPQTAQGACNNSGLPMTANRPFLPAFPIDSIYLSDF